MRAFFVLVSCAALAACSSPPPQPKCEGEFRPVNQGQRVSAATLPALALCSKTTGVQHG